MSTTQSLQIAILALNRITHRLDTRADEGASEAELVDLIELGQAMSEVVFERVEKVFD